MIGVAQKVEDALFIPHTDWVNTEIHVSQMAVLPDSIYKYNSMWAKKIRGRLNISWPWMT